MVAFGVVEGGATHFSAELHVKCLHSDSWPLSSSRAFLNCFGQVFHSLSTNHMLLTGP